MTATLMRPSPTTFVSCALAVTMQLVAPDIGPEDLLARWHEVVGSESYAVPPSTAESVRWREELLSNG